MGSGCCAEDGLTRVVVLVTIPDTIHHRHLEQAAGLGTRLLLSLFCCGAVVGH